mmetsp:Transcript_77539/g.185983  ORF Transcript_77539/g.185983 Transcript_77539/m.185983 type:complete len:233 (+) Transcript_77539:756-1454(+)
MQARIVVSLDAAFDEADNFVNQILLRLQTVKLFFCRHPKLLLLCHEVQRVTRIQDGEVFSQVLDALVCKKPSPLGDAEENPHHILLLALDLLSKFLHLKGQLLVTEGQEPLIKPHQAFFALVVAVSGQAACPVLSCKGVNKLLDLAHRVPLLLPQPVLGAQGRPGALALALHAFFVCTLQHGDVFHCVGRVADKPIHHLREHPLSLFQMQSSQQLLQILPDIICRVFSNMPV